MTPREIERHAKALDSATVLLRRLPSTLVTDDDGQGAARIVMSVLAKVSSVERWARREIVDILDELEDQRIESSQPRTAEAVAALVAGMRTAVDRMPDGPAD